MKEFVSPFPEDQDTPEMREMLENHKGIQETNLEGLKIKIVDMVCGGGKTSAAINLINNSPKEKKFLYITPYLTEVERILTECSEKHFVQPKSIDGKKINGIEQLLNRGRNIVSTHALFLCFNSTIIELLKIQDYTLILDEVVDVARQVDEIKGNDLKYLLNYTIPGENGILRWNKDKKYEGTWLSKYRNYIDLEALYYYKGTAILYLFPVKCFTAFKDIYVLTYMFDAQIQRCYFDFNNLKYDYYHVESTSEDKSNTSAYYFVKGKECLENREKFSNLINVVDDKKLNEIGDTDSALSVTWYNKNRGTILIKKLQNNTYNFFHNVVQTPSGLNLWTTFEKNRDALKGDGYKKSFLACNARATNEYLNRTSIAYLCNRYYDPILKGFFVTNNITVKEDDWALSELLQFIFRSAIRQEKKITLYLPSSRMRRLLTDWLTEPERNKQNLLYANLKQEELGKFGVTSIDELTAEQLEECKNNIKQRFEEIQSTVSKSTQ